MYDRLSVFAWPLVRVAAGLIMLSHGVPKLFGNFAPVLAERVLTPLGFRTFGHNRRTGQS